MLNQDVDWKDDVTFATCSTDKAIHTCVVGEELPRQTFTGQHLKLSSAVDFVVHIIMFRPTVSFPLL